MQVIRQLGVYVGTYVVVTVQTLCMYVEIVDRYVGTYVRYVVMTIQTLCMQIGMQVSRYVGIQVCMQVSMRQSKVQRSLICIAGNLIKQGGFYLLKMINVIIVVTHLDFSKEKSGRYVGSQVFRRVCRYVCMQVYT